MIIWSWRVWYLKINLVTKAIGELMRKDEKCLKNLFYNSENKWQKPAMECNVICLWKQTRSRENEHVDKFIRPAYRNLYLFCFFPADFDIFTSNTDVVLVEIWMRNLFVSNVNFHHFFCIPFPSLLFLCSADIHHPLSTSLSLHKMGYRLLTT